MYSIMCDRCGRSSIVSSTETTPYNWVTIMKRDLCGKCHNALKYFLAGYQLRQKYDPQKAPDGSTKNYAKDT